MTQRLGYKTLALFGCMGNSRDFCSQCKSTDLKGSKINDGEIDINFEQ